MAQATKTKSSKKKSAAPKAASAKDLNIKLFRGRANADERQSKVLTALGLGKSQSEAQHDDSPTIRGMLRKVAHLVEVTKIN